MLRKCLTRGEVDFEALVVNGVVLKSSLMPDVEVVAVSFPNVEYPYWTIVLEWCDPESKKTTIVTTGQVGVTYTEKT